MAHSGQTREEEKEAEIKLVEVQRSSSAIESGSQGRALEPAYQGPSFKEWVAIVLVCLVFGYWLAITLLENAQNRKTLLDVNVHFNSTDGPVVIPLQIEYGPRRTLKD